MTEPTKRVAPYLPFKTFLSSLDALSHGVPPKIDRTLWRSQSGVTQGLIMNAYRFFGLVDDNDNADDHLDRMARRPDQRAETLRFLIEAQYGEMLEGHDLTKMTLKMLEELFDKYFSVSGGTKQKAITFFLKAAKFSDMPLSPYLAAQLRATRKKRGTRQRGSQDNGNGAVEVAVATSVPSVSAPAASVHVVRLVSGGTLTISITANPFKMPQQDREFVFSLIDKLQQYENEHSSEKKEEEEEQEVQQ
jgi:hypothetical protein